MTRAIFSGFLAVAAMGLAHATPSGLYDPFGRADAGGVNYAVWDTFNEHYSSGSGAGTLYTYSGNATPSSNLTGLSLTQSSAHINAATGGGAAQGAGLLSGGDIYYSSTRAQSWTLNATTSIDLTTMAFQIKTANVGGVVDSLFVPTLAGVGAAAYFRSLNTGEQINGFDAYVIEYRWTDLEIAAGSNLSIGFSLAGGSSGNFTRKPVDFVALDVATVPEPASSVLWLTGLGLIAWLRRRPSRTARA
ncbi:MAG TPA: PEP-CTERM sorting domain-containing protein [Chthoniobacterales bacterium]